MQIRLDACYVCGHDDHYVKADDRPIDLVPGGIELATAPDQVKASLMTRLATLPDATVSLNIGLCEPGIRLAHPREDSRTPFQLRLFTLSE